MATAFLILKGNFRGRHYDRLEDEAEHMIIRPTIDRSFAAGEHSTVSDYKDNVHWFTATSEQAFIFNIHVMNVDPDKKNTGRVYIDPNGEKLRGNASAPGGSARARSTSCTAKCTSFNSIIVIARTLASTIYRDGCCRLLCR